MSNLKAKPKYSDFGLDDVKRNKDKDTVGTYFCAFDGWDENFGAPGHNVSSGFSFCFSNFCICPDCVQGSYLPENSARWFQDDCFKCKRKNVSCYHDTGDGDIATICENCMQWAAEVLKIETNKKSYNMARKKIVDEDIALEAISINKGDAVKIVKGKLKGSTGLVKEIRQDGTVFIEMDELAGGVEQTHMCKSIDIEVIQNPRSDMKVGDMVRILKGVHVGEIGVITENYVPGMVQIEIETDGKGEKISTFNDWILPVSIVKKPKVLSSRESQKEEVQSIKLLHIPLLQISEDPNQPRKTFDDKAVHELADSIKQQGVLQPILVRPDADGYMIVCGERRYRASVIAGLETIPATVRNLLDDEALEIQITENLQRKDVDPMEEAASFSVMIEKMGYSNADIAAKIGKEEKFVIRRLKLNSLIPELKNWLHEGLVNIGQAERLAALDTEIQQEWYDRWKTNTSYIPKYKELVWWIENNIQKNLSKALFDLNETDIFENAPACTTCSFNTSIYSLFNDTEDAICTNRECFNQKSSSSFEKGLNEALTNPTTLLFKSGYGGDEKGKQLTKEGYHVFEHYQVDILEKPKLPKLPENSSKAESDDYDRKLEEYTNKYAEYEKKLATSVRGFDVASGRSVLIASVKVKSEESKVGDSRQSITAREKILDLESKKNRATELDQEKIMRRLVDHMAENVPEGNLTESEFYCIYVDYLNRIGYGQKSDRIQEKFGIEKGCYSANNGKHFLEKVTEQGSEDLAKMVRISLLSNYSGIFPKSLSGAIIFHLAKSWCPDVLKTAELEQEEARIKREARIDAQIKELEKEIKN